jgi:hypothetical protein
LFSEHSDWAAGDPPLNPAREKGCTLIVSKNKGIYAEVNEHHTLNCAGCFKWRHKGLAIKYNPSYPRRLENRFSDMSGADLCDGDARNDIE